VESVVAVREDRDDRVFWIWIVRGFAWLRAGIVHRDDESDDPLTLETICNTLVVEV